VTLIGKRVMIVKGPNKGDWGTVTHADRDSFRMVRDFDDPFAIGTFDRIENIVRAKE
jgi:hypothetical protein